MIMAYSIQQLSSDLCGTILSILEPEDVALLHNLADDAKIDTAMYNLGRCYLKGYSGCPVDIDKGVGYLRSAAYLGHPKAMAQCAIWAQEDDIAEKDEDLCTLFLKKLIKAGYPEEEADPCNTLTAFFEAAKFGNPFAQHQIALWLSTTYESNVLPKDDELSTLYYKNAVDQQYKPAEEDLGLKCMAIGVEISKAALKKIKAISVMSLLEGVDLKEKKDDKDKENAALTVSLEPKPHSSSLPLTDMKDSKEGAKEGAKEAIAGAGMLTVWAHRSPLSPVNSRHNMKVNKTEKAGDKASVDDMAKAGSSSVSQSESATRVIRTA